MNVLFITSSRLGDAVLSTGLLAHIVDAYPQARITVVCGGLPSSLFAAVPGLERVIVLKKQSWKRHWIKLWRQVAGTRWDMVVDLRDSAVSRLIRARKRYIMGRAVPRDAHKVAQNAAVMALSPPPAPRLWFAAHHTQAARDLIPEGAPVLAVGPTANWLGKTWPADRFIALIQALTAADGILPHARVAIFAAPGEEDVARTVLASIPEARRLDLIARTDPATAAACLARCDFYVGNDSGLMHCAAAVGIPTFGLFGPSWPHLYRPWGAHTDYAATAETFAQLIDYPGYTPKTAPSLMTTLDLQTVQAGIKAFAHRIGFQGASYS